MDNLPNSVMEALSCGVPVVAFNTGGIPEMVEHKRNGYVAKQKNIYNKQIIYRLPTAHTCFNQIDLPEYPNEATLRKKYLTISTYESSLIGILLFAIGTMAFFPFKCVNRSSFGLIQIAVSPRIVSGRVVAMVNTSSLPSIL